MSIEVIGAGFGRTGTLSLKFALQQLGFADCYHMRDVFAHPGHAETWTRLARGEEIPDWPTLLAGYRSVVDWPCAYFWRELTEHYPQARVLLSVRDANTWYDSMVETIFTAIGAAFPNDAIEPQLPEGTPAVSVAQIVLAKTIIVDHLFQGKLRDRQHCIDVYNRHNAEVQRSVAPENLLVYEVKQGWGPLCEFLNVPEPSAPFPRTNSKEEFHKGLGTPAD